MLECKLLSARQMCGFLAQERQLKNIYSLPTELLTVGARKYSHSLALDIKNGLVRACVQVYSSFPIICSAVEAKDHISQLAAKADCLSRP